MKKVLYLFGELTDEDIEWLMANGSRQEIRVGTVLINEGKPTDALHIVLTGALSATVKALHDREIERLGGGAIVGEMSFVDGQSPSATVVAREDSVVLSLPRSLIARKLRQDLGFAARFYKAIAIFLSDRLRGKVRMLAGDGQLHLDEDEIADDELDPVVMETVYLAGTRFERMLKRLAEAR